MTIERSVTRKSTGREKRWKWGAYRENLTPLYHLLQETFPTMLTIDGYLSFKELSHELGYSHQGLRRLIEANRLTPRLATRLLEISKGSLTPDQLWPFLEKKSKE